MQTEGLTALLFDVDGVLLVDTATDPSINREAARYALEQADVADESGELWEMLATARSNEAFEQALAKIDADPGELWAYREEEADRLGLESLAYGQRPSYHDIGVVERLAQQYPVGIASNNRHETVSAVAEVLFDGAIDAAVGRQPTFEDYQRKKPMPDFLERALKSLELDPEDDAHTIGYVGDRQKDILAAHSAGLASIFLRRPHNLHLSLDPTPDYEISGLGELEEIMA